MPGELPPFDPNTEHADQQPETTGQANEAEVPSGQPGPVGLARERLKDERGVNRWQEAKGYPIQAADPAGLQYLTDRNLAYHQRQDREAKMANAENMQPEPVDLNKARQRNRLQRIIQLIKHKPEQE